MRRNFKKVIAVASAVAVVTSGVTYMPANVNADVQTEAMAAPSSYESLTWAQVGTKDIYVAAIHGDVNDAFSFQLLEDQGTKMLIIPNVAVGTAPIWPDFSGATLNGNDFEQIPGAGIYIPYADLTDDAYNVYEATSAVTNDRFQIIIKCGNPSGAEETTTSEAQETTTATEETTTEETTTVAGAGIELDQTFAGVESDNTYTLGGYTIYVGGWNGSNAVGGVDAADSDHIKIQQTSSLWYDAWGLQVKKGYTGLTPGQTYNVSWTFTADSADGTFKVTNDDATHNLVAGTQTVTGTIEASAEGTAEFVIGLGWVGLTNVLEFQPQVITEVTEEETTTAEETTTSEEETTTSEVEETTTATEETTAVAGADIELDQTFAGVESDNTYTLGDYTIYVGGWNGSNAVGGVDAANPDHIKIQQTSSLWYDAWGLQVKKAYTGLTPGQKYNVSWTFTADSADGSFKVTNDDATHDLVAGTQTVTGTIEASEEGTAEFVIGLGWVGLTNVLEFQPQVITEVTEEETTTAEETTTSEGEETTTSEEESTSEAAEDWIAAPGDWKTVGNWQIYFGGWAGNGQYRVIDDNTVVLKRGDVWNWDKWGTQIKVQLIGTVTAGETYTFTCTLKANSTDGKIQPTDDEASLVLLTGEEQTFTLTAVAEEAEGVGTVVQFGLPLGWVGSGVEMTFSNPVVKDSTGNVVYPVEKEQETTTAETTTATEEESTTQKVTTEVPSTQNPIVKSQVKIAKVTRKNKASKKIKITLTKRISGATGYSVRVYKTYKNAKANKNVLVKFTTKKNIKTINVTNKKFANKKTLYVRVRAYKTVKGKKIYANKWSNTVRVKIKK